jgi:hypothetical protein
VFERQPIAIRGLARRFNSAGTPLGNRSDDSSIIVADETPEPPDRAIVRPNACRRMRVRPDGHGAWRAERPPDDLNSLLDQIRDAIATGVRG